MHTRFVMIGLVAAALFPACQASGQSGNPSISAGGVVNGASYAPGAPVAPGSIASVFGTFLLSTPSGASNVPLPTSLSGLSMQFSGGRGAPLFYAAGGQVNIQIPWELTGSQTSLAVTVNGRTSATQTVKLTSFAPGIFTTNSQGTGQGAILDSAYRLVDSSNPATPGSTVLQIYCTGLGPVSNRPPSGAPAPSSPLAVTTTSPTVTIGGVPAPVLFSGLAPGFVGLYQVNAQVPAIAAAGNAMPVVISIGGYTSNEATIAVKQIVNPNAALGAVTPNSGPAGQVFTVVFTGVSTNFAQGQTLANFGPGISVAGAPQGEPGTLTIASPASATARITIDPAAAAGTRNIIVTTGTQTLSLSNGFTVLPAPAPMGPLAITSTSPANGATGILLTPTIQVVFNEPLDPATAGPSTFSIASGKTSLPATVAYDSTKNLVSLTPAGVLSPQTTYTVTIGALVRNAAENPLGIPSTFSFTTMPPTSVTGAVTAPAGVDPTTLTVLSFGGRTSTPSTGGNFSASVNPAGVGLVAAMIPGKDFGLLAATVSGGAVAASTPVLAAADSSPSASPPAAASPRVYATQWQVTASPWAAVSPNNLAVDFQTTAEWLIFMSPYLFTSDPQKATAILSAIAANPATAQLAQVLAQNATKSDPLTDPAVQAAGQNAIAAIVQALARKSSDTTTFSYRPGNGPSSMREPRAVSAITLSAMVAVTPRCWPGLTSGGALPCLDLNYISFPAGSITVNQANGSYSFQPENCTEKGRLGCAIGWLAQVKLLPAGADPASIAVTGGGSYGPASPWGVYDATSCGTSACYSAWVSGKSWFENLSVSGLLVKSLSKALKLDDLAGPSFSLPATPAARTDYIARFYSGAGGDPWEDAKLAAYANGSMLAFQAYLLNLMDVVFNFVDMFGALVPVPGAGTMDDLKECALQQTALDLAKAGSAITNTNTVSGFVDTVRTTAVDLLENLASCGLHAAGGAINDTAKQLIKMGEKGLKWVPVIGQVLTALDVASSLGQAVQRGVEMVSSASAVETAVISIKPGSPSVNNPVPSITSLSPSSAPVGGSSQSVTIRGSNLLTISTVAVDNEKRDYTLGNDYGITVKLDSSDLSQERPLMIAVTNPSPGGGTSEAIFMVGNPTASLQPKITSLRPSGATAGSGPLVLTILGAYFLPNATVTANGSSRPVTTPSDAGQLTITLAASDLAKVGVFPVVVKNPGGGNPSNAFNFAVLDPKPSQPAVTCIWTTARVYVAGDQFAMNYTTLAGTTSGAFDLMISFLSMASGNTYYYYDDASDSNSRWIHSTPRAAWKGTPQTGQFVIPAAEAAGFQVTADVPSGDYHVKAYFSKTGANQPVGAIAETDFSVATSTPAGECFIATAAFGSPMAYQVQCLRVFRNRILLPTGVGRAFIRWYYGWSPGGAAWLRAHSVARKATRAVLWIPLGFAWLSLQTHVAVATLALLMLLVSVGWSLWRGSAWWRALCLLVVAVGPAAGFTRSRAASSRASRSSARAQVGVRNELEVTGVRSKVTDVR